jgi:hypothetical protein
MNYLKLTSKGFETYNGHLNIILFRDGISTTPVPERIADRIAAATACVACDEDGNTGETLQHVGIQNRLIDDSKNRAPVAKRLARQSDSERSVEERVDLSKALKAPSETLYTRQDLELLADKAGIKGLRDIGKNWKVTGRAIPELIEKILNAQAKFLKQREQALESRGATKNRVTTIAQEEKAVEVVEEVPAAASIEGLAEAYTANGEVVVTGVQLVERALKNSGKSLTGWNTLTDKERKPFIDREITALEVFNSARLKPVVTEASAEEKSAEPEKAVEPEKAAEETKQEATPEGEGEKQPESTETPEGEKAPEDETPSADQDDADEDNASDADDEDDGVDFIDEDEEAGDKPADEDAKKDA